MSVDYILPNFPLYYISIPILFAVYYIATKFYTKNKKKPLRNRGEVIAYGKFFLFLAILYPLIWLMIGFEIYQPHLILTVSATVIAIILIFTDGWLTHKAMGNYQAIESNPLMNILMKLIPFKYLRYAVLGIASGFIIYLAVTGLVRDILIVCLMWTLVDTNNMLTLRRLKLKHAIKIATLNDELGFDDIHEF